MRGAYSPTNHAGHRVHDSLAQVALLPAEKLHVLRDLIRSWLPARKSCYRRELESLIGHCIVQLKLCMWPGRTFFRRMTDLLCCFRTKNHPIRFN